MAEHNQKKLGKILWSIADDLRGAMNADDFRDYMLALLFLRYLSDNYEQAAQRELGKDYPDPNAVGNGGRTPLGVWYDENPRDVATFEAQMRKKAHYVIEPTYLWAHIAHLARTQSPDLLKTLDNGFNHIENDSFQSTFAGLFSEINLGSEKLGKTYAQRNEKLCTIVGRIAEKLAEFDADIDTLGDAYEYLIGEFAAGSGKKAGEFYTPQRISSILSSIVTLDGHAPEQGPRKKLGAVYDFACGSGSLLLNVRRHIVDPKEGKPGTVGMIYGQEKNVTTYNLARMNMLLHGVKDSEFHIHHGDTLVNDWDLLTDPNPAKRPKFDAVVANPPFSYRWKPGDDMGEDPRFKDHGIAPKSAADFAFLLHGLHYLKDDGVMAIILPHGVLFRGAAEAKIRRKLLDEGHIDTVIGLPANLFYSTGIPVCILVLKKCKRSDDVLFINAEKHFDKGKRQNFLSEEHVDTIVETYKQRPEKPIERYARRVPMSEIVENDYNLNISRYVSTAEPEEEIDLKATHKKLVGIEKEIQKAKKTHNGFLEELGLKPLP